MQYGVRDDKLLRYLLAVAPFITVKNRGKTKFFHQIGFDHADIAPLKAALLLHPETAVMEAEYSTEYGLRRVFRCFLPVAPNGGRYCIRSIWSEQPDGKLWLSTAYPCQPA